MVPRSITKRIDYREENHLDLRASAVHIPSAMCTDVFLRWETVVLTVTYWIPFSGFWIGPQGVLVQRNMYRDEVMVSRYRALSAGCLDGFSICHSIALFCRWH